MTARAILISVCLAFPFILAAPASAHHGWAWSTGENIQLTGVIREVKLGNPHGRVMLDVDGVVWRLEVGQPWRNARAGLKDGDLAVGVKLTVDGEPSADPEDKHLKVERLWIDGTEFQLYPERL